MIDQQKKKNEVAMQNKTSENVSRNLNKCHSRKCQSLQVTKTDLSHEETKYS
jgi:hypothetical protein